MNYTTAPYGLMGFADFMKKAGYIKKTPAKASDVCWENLLAIMGERCGGPSPIEKLQYR
jgi:NitT/TauT family transport system substrate-binding protein